MANPSYTGFVGHQLCSLCKQHLSVSQVSSITQTNRASSCATPQITMATESGLLPSATRHVHGAEQSLIQQMCCSVGSRFPLRKSSVNQIVIKLMLYCFLNLFTGVVRDLPTVQAMAGLYSGPTICDSAQRQVADHGCVCLAQQDVCHGCGKDVAQFQNTL